MSEQALDRFDKFLDAFDKSDPQTQEFLKSELEKWAKGDPNTYTGPIITPQDYAIYYNQTDEFIEKIIKRNEPYFNEWWGLLSHLNSTTLISNPQEVRYFRALVGAAYYQSLMFGGKGRVPDLDALRDFALYRIQDAIGGHRAKYLTEKRERRILDLPEQRQKHGLFGFLRG